MNTRGESGGVEVVVLLMLSLGAMWGWVVNVTPRPLYVCKKGGWLGARAGLTGYVKVF